MYQSLMAFSLSTICLISLSACATVTKTDVLLSGISPADATKPYPDSQMRAATDPVCMTFYDNSRTYIAETNKSNGGANFLTSIGTGVVASVASRSLGVSGISNTLGKVAAQQAVSLAVRQGSIISLEEIKSSSQGAQIKKTANAIHCPVSSAP